MIRRITNNHPVVLQIQREVVDGHKDVANITVGEAISTELAEETKRYELALTVMRAFEVKHERARQVLEVEKRNLEAQMWIIKVDSEEIALEYVQELEWVEMKMKHMETQARLDREEAKMEYQVQMTLLNRRLQAAEIEAEFERLTMGQQIRQLEVQLN